MLLTHGFWQGGGGVERSLENGFRILLRFEYNHGHDQGQKKLQPRASTRLIKDLNPMRPLL